LKEQSVALFKCTALFQMTTNVSSPSALHRIAGWSESVYFTGNTVADAINSFTGSPGANQPGSWCALRASLLPLGASVVGQRYQQLNPVGLSQSQGLVFPSTLGQEADTPQNTLLYKVPGQGVNNIRKVQLRCIPDICITEAEFSPPSNWQNQWVQFNAVNTLFQFQGRDLSQARQPILSGTAAGVFTTVNAPVVTIGQFVRILKVRDVNGNLRGGRFQVSAVTQGPNTITVAGWPYPASTGGTFRVDGQVFPYFSNYPPSSGGKIIVRKVGRPFGQYRGRRPRRR
jgi:hypothetical protein